MNRVTISSASELGPELRKLRTSKGLKILEVENLSGVSISTISMVEQGKQYPRMNTLVAYLDALGVDELVVRIPHK